MYETICQDTVGNPQGTNPFRLERLEIDAEPCNGSLYLGGQILREYKNWFTAQQYGRPGHLSVPGMPSEASCMARLMAQTNPGRATVSVPTFVGELRDFPGLLKSAGDAVFSVTRRGRRSRRAASAYLGYQFGLAPLIADISTFLEFESHVSKRVKELEAMWKNGGIRRRRTMFSGVASVGVDAFTAESGLGEVVKIHIIHTTRVVRWATVRWVPTQIPKFSGGDDAINYARRMVAGLGGSYSALETAWNLMPWSWLIDWCFGVSYFIEAYNNSVPCSATRGCVMTYTRSEETSRRTQVPPNSWVSGGTGRKRLETKERLVVAAGVNTNLPFLSGKQLSILGALAVARR